MSTKTIEGIEVRIAESNEYPRVLWQEANGTISPLAASEVSNVNNNNLGIYVKQQGKYYFVPKYVEQMLRDYINENDAEEIYIYDNKYKMSDFYPQSYQTMTYCNDLPVLNASSLTTCEEMFKNCYELEEIPYFYSDNVTNMKNMFENCQSLPERLLWPIGCDNISDVNMLKDMFKGSSVRYVKLNNVRSSLKSQINSQLLSGTDNLNIEFSDLSYEDYFNDVVRNEFGYLGLSKWAIRCAMVMVLEENPYEMDIQEAENMAMEYLCSVNSLATFFFDPIGSCMPKNMPLYFGYCQNISILNLDSQFDTFCTVDMHGMFEYCENLQSITVNNQDRLLLYTDNTIDMCHMFVRCEKLTSNNLPLFSNTKKVRNMSDMFNNCKSLTTVPLFDTRNVRDMQKMFYECDNLISVPQFDTHKVTNMNNMFYNCNKLTNIPQLNTENVTDMGNMFSYCENLVSIPQLNTSKVGHMVEMFYACSSLETIPELDTSSARNMNNMFNNCSSLPEEFPWVIDCSSIDLDNNNSLNSRMKNMFYGSSVKKVAFKNVKNNVRPLITSQLLKNNNDMIIEFF